VNGRDASQRRLLLMLLSASAAMAACGGGGGDGSPPASAIPPPSPPPPMPPTITKSANRGIAYDLVDVGDFSAVSPGVSWWYDWSSQAHGGTSAMLRASHGMDFIPMLWNGNFDDAQVQQMLQADPQIRYLLVVNEPNLTDQANLTPAQAAALWPRFEAIANATGVKIVGPQITWGTMAGFANPVTWLDAFYAAYRAANGGRDPNVDYLGFHWYDYGLAGQLDRLMKYGKSFWVTEMANWHNGDGSAQIDSVAEQKGQMSDMVATCEARNDVFRYAWFAGRWNPDPHFTSVLGASGVLTELGRYYLALPFSPT
jgi:hypothetical protein